MRTAGCRLRLGCIAALRHWKHNDMRTHAADVEIAENHCLSVPLSDRICCVLGIQRLAMRLFLRLVAQFFYCFRMLLERFGC